MSLVAVCACDRITPLSSPRRPGRAPGGFNAAVSTVDSILGRIAAGEAGATADCIAQYGGLVWSLARRLCPSHELAEDAVQDVFLAVWKSAGRFDPKQGSEVTFVATIARRRIIDRVRRASRSVGTAPVEGMGLAAPAARSDGLERGEDVRAAERALAELSEEQRRVIRMSVVHGLSHQEISQATGMPLGTVKTHLRRGLIRARELVMSGGSGAGAGGRREGVAT